MRVLLVNHTADYSGAEVALLRLEASLPADVARAVACPPRGPLPDALAASGRQHLPIAGTDLSFRLHPGTTARGLAGFARSGLDVARVARRWGADVIHANGPRAGLLAVPTARTRTAALVVQVHDMLPPGPLGRVVREVLARGADDVIAVSDTASRSFDRGLGRPVARTAPISIDHERFRAGVHDDAATRAALGVPPGAPLLGEVAQITPWKGQIVAIEAFAAIRRRHPDAQLLLIGHIAFAGPGVRYDNAAYLRSLHERVRELGLEAAVRFLGRRSDVPAIVSALDLMLLPSWEEPFGTSALEAMAVGTVPLVGSVGGPAEYVEDGVSGRVLPPREPERWAAAAIDLIDDPGRRRQMGERAREVAARFTDEAYAEACMAAYRRALATSRR